MLTYNKIIIDATKGTGGISDDLSNKETLRKHDKYESDIMDQLVHIERYLIGHTVLSWINNSPRTLTIQPAFGGLCPDKTHADSPEDAYPSDNYVLTENDETHVVSVSSKKGTHQGSDVDAYFTAENYMLNDKGWNQCSGGKYGSEPDEALFHELVHALRQMYGIYYPYPTAGTHLKDYDDEEEFFAVVATNVYISGKGKNDQLRGNHRGPHEPLDDDQHTSASFIDNDDNRELLKRQCFANRNLWYAFAQAPGQFNPFRELRDRAAKGRL